MSSRATSTPAPNLIIARFRVAQLYSSLANRARLDKQPIADQRALATRGVTIATDANALIKELDAAGKLDPSKKQWIGLIEQVR